MGCKKRTLFNTITAASQHTWCVVHNFKMPERDVESGVVKPALPGRLDKLWELYMVYAKTVTLEQLAEMMIDVYWDPTSKL